MSYFVQERIQMSKGRPKKTLSGSQARIHGKYATYAHLELGELESYMEGLREKRRQGRIRNIQGQFTSDAHHLASYLIAMVKSKILTLPRNLEQSTILYKMNTLGRNKGGGESGEDGGSKLLVLGNTGKFVENPLMHTGLYYDSIGFSDSPLSLNRRRKLELVGDKYVQGGRIDFQNIGIRPVSKRKTEITVGIKNGQTPIYPAGSGKMWTMEQIAAFHEYGTVSEVARPVWGPAIEEFNQMTAKGGLLRQLFKKTYNACEEFLLGTNAERNMLSGRPGGRVGGSSFPSIYNKSSFIKALYDTNFAKKPSKMFTKVGFKDGRYIMEWSGNADE